MERKQPMRSDAQAERPGLSMSIAESHLVDASARADGGLASGVTHVVIGDTGERPRPGGGADGGLASGVTRTAEYVRDHEAGQGA